MTTSSNPPVGPLRHVVLFQFKSEISTEQIHQVESDFCALPSKISAIRDFEWGGDVSNEGLAEGFTHCFIVTFDSIEGRNTYQTHPDHVQFSEMVVPLLKRVLVYDFHAQS